MITGDPIQAEARHQEEEKKMEQTSSCGSPGLAEDIQPVATPLSGIPEARDHSRGQSGSRTRPHSLRGEALLDPSDLRAAVSLPGFPCSLHCRPHNSLLTNNFLPVPQRKTLRPKEIKPPC